MSLGSTLDDYTKGPVKFNLNPVPMVHQDLQFSQYPQTDSS